MERVQKTDDQDDPVMDERGDPVYGYPESGQSTIHALTSELVSDSEKQERSAGFSESEILTIIIKDTVDVGPKTRFQVGDFIYSIQQRKATKRGQRKILLERVVE